jgi:transcriptional regulator with XRE-family HTH domain
MSEPLPDLKTLPERLRWARERAGFTSPREAARAFGWNPNTYKSHELGIRGVRGLPETTLKKYGRALRVPWEWLTLGVVASPSQSEEIARMLDYLAPEDRNAVERMVRGLAERREDAIPRETKAPKKRR